MKMRFLKILTALGVLGFVLAGCAAENDVSFARRLLDQLISGRFTARQMIDWPKLNMMLYDVGTDYSRFQSDQARTDYERSFIENFSKGFKQGGAKTSAFFNWRLLEEKDATTFFNWRTFEEKGQNLTVVTANCHDKQTTAYFVIEHEKEKRKLVALEILGEKARYEKTAKEGENADVAPSQP